MDILINLTTPGEVLMLRNETDIPITFQNHCGDRNEIILGARKTIFIIIGTVIPNSTGEKERYVTFGSSLKSVARRASKQIANGDEKVELFVFNEMHDSYIKHLITINDYKSEIVITIPSLQDVEDDENAATFIERKLDVIMISKI